MKEVDRKNWTMDEPCLFCGWFGDHKAEPKNNGAHKVSCGKCGKYQKFVSNKEIREREMYGAIARDL